MVRSDRVTRVLAAAVAAAGATLGLSIGSADEPTTPTNFVIIMADDLGYGDLSCYGGRIPTPNIDKLAAGGLRFLDFHSNGSVCSPTRAALMSALYQQRVGVPEVIVARADRPAHRWGLDDQLTTLSEALGQAGYRTALFGKWHLGYLPQFHPTRHGFDEFRGYLSGNVDYFSHIDQTGRFDWWRNEQLEDDTGYVTHLITKYAIDFLSESSTRPFFLYLAHEAPHYPYQGPNDGPDRTVGGRFANHGSRKDRHRAYAEMITELDNSVGAVHGKLRELGIADNTLIWFSSDNGATPLGSNGPLRGHKGSLWEGGHRVPSIASWPGTIPASSTKELAMTFDIAVTVTAIAGATWPHTVDGWDLRRSWQTRQTANNQRTVFWEFRERQAVREGRWKLHAHRNGGRPRLYDLEHDLCEQRNIAHQHPDIVVSLQTKLNAWSRNVNNSSH